jgi:2-desacetyl-2-hydroxyethyl bacteriochlorophyllide A dehydrogenase
MKAFCLVEPFKVEMREGPVPRIKTGEVLIKVQTVSICGTDIHAYHGRQPLFDYPRIIGHEVCGLIEETDGNSNAFKKGDKVIVIPYISCGKCIACRKKKFGCCEKLTVKGVHIDGALAEYMTMPEDYVIKIPDSSDPIHAAVIEPYAISAHAVHNARVKAGENLLINGIGPIGLGAAEIAKTYGANIILAETSEQRRDFAKSKFGYDQILNPLDSTFRDLLADYTGDDFPDTIIDSTGSGKSMESCIKNLSHGGKVVFVGMHNGDLTINAVEFHKRQTELYGSRGATRFDFEYVITCMNEKKTDPGKFVTHKLAFDNTLPENFKAMMAKGSAVFKLVITVNQ